MLVGTRRLSAALTVALLAGATMLLWLLGLESPMVTHAGGVESIVLPAADSPRASSGVSTTVSGYINEDTTWAQSGSPYVVIGDVTVSPGVTLTIEPGVEVRFDGYYRLLTRGILSASGSPAAPITFTRHGESGTWQGITTGDDVGQPAQVLEHVVVEYATTGFAVNRAGGTSVRNSVFRQNGTGLNMNSGGAVISGNLIISNTVGMLVRASAAVISNSILYNSSYGIQLDWKADPFDYNLICGNGGDGIYWLGNGVETGRYNTITANQGHGIFMYSNFKSNSLQYNNIYGNGGYNLNALYAGRQLLEFDNNWWGTADPTIINQLIYDFYDNPDLGIMDYTPFATVPISSAPPACNASVINLLASYMTATPDRVTDGDNITYTIRLNNTGAQAAQSVTLEAGIPTNTTYISNTVSGGATYNSLMEQIEWSGTVSGNSSVSITFQVQLGSGISECTPISSSATIDHPSVGTIQRTATAVAGTSTCFSGYINENTTWTQAESPYIIVGDVTVSQEVTLTVEPGVEVRFNGNYELVTRGILSAVGSTAAPITFTRHGDSGTWQGIRDAQDPSQPPQVLDHVVVEYAVTGLKLNGADNSSIRNSLFRFNSTGMDVRSEGSVISGNLIISNTLGMRIDSAGQVIANSILYNTSDGVEFVSGSFNSNLVCGNGGYGVSMRANHLDMGRYNTITANGGDGVILDGTFQLSNTFQYNNLYANGGYDMRRDLRIEIGLDSNWWGTTDQAIIDQLVYDFFDDPDLGLVDYTPVATQSIASAPPPCSASLVNLIASHKTASPDRVTGGDNITYTMLLRNTGGQTANGVTLEDPIPTNTTYVSTSVSSGATYNPLSEQIEWTGSVTANSSISITYQVQVGTGISDCTPITNSATISHESGILQRTATAIAGTPTCFSGYVNENTTWFRSESPYIIIGDVIVSPGVTLTVEPGVEVRFDGYYRLLTRGLLSAVGTPAAPITFTRHRESGTWQGITTGHDYGQPPQALERIVVEHATTGLVVNEAQGTSVHSSIFRFNDTGMNMNSQNAVISGNLVISNTVGMLVRSGGTVISNSIVFNSSHGVESLSGSFNHNLVCGNGGDGVSTSAGNLDMGRYNTVTANRGDGVVLSGVFPMSNTFQFNNLYANGGYDMRRSERIDTGFDSNWWGTTDQTIINLNVYDFYDNPDRGIVSFVPFSQSPVPQAPTACDATVIVPDFQALVSPSSTTLGAGDSALFNVDLISLKGTDSRTLYLDDEPVTLSVLGLPHGGTAAFSSNPVTPTDSTSFTITSDTNARSGIYPLTIWTESDHYQHAARLELTITSTIPAPPTGPCGWDAYETNDSWQQAYTIGARRAYTSTICSTSDQDWFRSYITTPFSIFSTTLSALPEDYDLVVYGPEIASDDAIPDLGEVQQLDDDPDNGSIQDLGSILRLSAQRGLEDEQVSVSIFDTPGWYYFQVVGHNGAYSSSPYSLIVHVRLPGSTPPPETSPGDTPPTPPSPDPSVRTLILVHSQRVAQYYGTAAGTSLLAKLDTLAAHPTVSGTVIYVEDYPSVAQAYALWDPYSPEAANYVAATIKDLISDTLPLFANAEFLVLVGHDDIIPHRRVDDRSSIGLESEYEGLQYLIDSSSLFNAMSRDFFLSDDYYAALSPLRFRGRQLYIPELAVGRLVETPAQIEAQIDAYLASQQLAATDGLVTGYSPVSDYGGVVAARLRGFGLSVDSTLSDDTWTAAQLKSLWLDQRHHLNAISGRFDHFRVAQPDGVSWLTSQDVLSSSADLGGVLIYTLGSHAGFNVPDVDSGASPQTLDFPQAWGQENGMYVAPLSFAYSDQSGLGFSERLLEAFSRQLGQPGPISVGQALVAAKQEYLNRAGFSGFGPLDEKTLAGMVLYGLPMYQVDLPAARLVAERGAGATQVPPPIPISPTLAVAQVTLSPTLSLSTTASGDYFHVDGETQAAPGFPVLPRTSLPITAPGWSAHGALLTGASYQTITDVIPLIGSSVTETIGASVVYTPAGWYPSRIGTVNRLPLQASAMERLVILPAQFGPGEVWRTYDQLVYQIYYSSSDQRTPPTIQEVDATCTNGIAHFSATVQSELGTYRVVVAYTTGSGPWQTLDLAPSGGGSWQGSLPLSADIHYFLQAVDNAGNVAQLDNKGLYFELLSDLRPVSTVVTPGAAASLTYTDTQGNTTTISLPMGAVSATTTLILTPLPTATPPTGFTFAGHAFSLEAYQGGTHLPGFTFQQPVTITIHYSDTDIAGLDETALQLEYWDGDQWLDAACGPYQRHPDENWVAVPVCHLSDFALFSQSYTIYLPTTMRKW
jgi:uncharacterized repeat protein (TIGR01451 family)